MLLTKTKALEKIKDETGLSIAACESLIAKMPTVPDGARKKINSYHVQAAINQANAPIGQRTSKFSKKQIERIQRVGA